MMKMVSKMSFLKDAFREAARREFAHVPEESELNVVFSDNYLARMEELLSKQTIKRCFFIGHSDAPDALRPLLDITIERCIVIYQISQYVVGHYGNFDRLVTSALVEAKRIHPEIQLLCLTPYHPPERVVELPPEFDGTLYPEGMETVPRQFAIAHANRYMVDHCDRLVAYVFRDGSNAGKVLRRAKKNGTVIDNLAEYNYE